jgi:hypothetical protein
MLLFDSVDCLKLYCNISLHRFGLFCSLDPASVPGIPLDMGKNGKASKRGKNGLKSALQLVQHSTASMGRYYTNFIFDCSSTLLVDKTFLWK